MSSGISTVAAKDVLLVFSEHGKQPRCIRSAASSASAAARSFRSRATRESAARACRRALLVSAHDERAHIEPLLYQSALQHLLDLIFVLLCEDGNGRLKQLDANLARIRHIQEP